MCSKYSGKTNSLWEAEAFDFFFIFSCVRMGAQYENEKQLQNNNYNKQILIVILIVLMFIKNYWYVNRLAVSQF